MKGLKTNDIGKSVKYLIIFLKTPVVKKLLPFMNLTDFKILKEKDDTIYLAMAEIKKIWLLHLLTASQLQKYLDLFGCSYL